MQGFRSIVRDVYEAAAEVNATSVHASSVDTTVSAIAVALNDVLSEVNHFGIFADGECPNSDSEEEDGSNTAMRVLPHVAELVGVFQTSMNTRHSKANNSEVWSSLPLVLGIGP